MNIWAAIPLAACLAYLLLLLLVLPNAQQRVSRYLAYFLAAASVWGFCSFMIHLDAPASETLLWNNLLAVSLVWALVAYFHFVRVYVYDKAGPSMVAAYSVLAVVAGLAAAGKLVESARVEDGIVYSEIGAPVYLIAAASAVMAGLIAAGLLRKYSSLAPGLERQSVLFLLGGLLITVTAGFSNLSGDPNISGLPIDQLASFINAAFIGLIVSRFRFVNLKFRDPHRGLTYVLIVPAVVISLAGIISVTFGINGAVPEIGRFNGWAVIPLVASVVYIILLFMVAQDSERRANRFFAYFLGVGAFWSFSSFMLVFNSAASPGYLQFWNEIVVVAIAWVSIAYFHFVRAYNNQSGGIWIWIGYAFTLILLGLALAGEVVSNVRLVDGYLFHDIRPWDLIVGGFIAPFIAAGMIMLIRRYRTSTDPVDRNRTIYLIIGSGALILFSYITPFMPALAGLTTDHLGNIANAGLIAYAMSRYHLFDIKLVARRGLTLIALVAAIGAGYGGLVFIVSRLFPGAPNSTIVLIAGIAVTMLALSGRSLAHFISVSIDRLFYRDTYRHRLELLDFSTKMSHILNLDELSQALLPPLTKALGITHAALLFQDNSAADFTVQYTFPDNHELRGTLRLPVDNPIIEWMDREGRPLAPSQVESIPEFKGLWQTEREQLTGANLALLHPIKSRGKLIGLIAVGQKKRGGIYNTEDLELISRIASQAGVIIENAQLYVQATTRANTDELTGLYNHRHFHERIEQEIARGSRFGISFSLIILDLDLFKVYNDIYGHLAGDQLLRKVGKIIQSSVRSIDLSFRYGGEEFAIILPETRIEDAYRVAERLRKTVEAKSSFREMPVTASLGVATWPSDGVMKEEVIHRADTALYRAKQTGRNRTCLASEVQQPIAQPAAAAAEGDSQPKALSIIYALAATVDAKDHYTYGHSRKVSEYAVALAEALRLPQDTIHTIRAAGLLHDIGKIGVPDSILTKPGALEQKEWEPIRTHPELGVEILRHVTDLSQCLPAIMHHHENWDGTGYPQGLKGPAIPLEARILSVADAYDAITSPRPYRNQLALKDALAELRRCAGTQFDPSLVPVFCELMQPGAGAVPGIERRAEYGPSNQAGPK
ncbi:diguanylate cyclase [Dehalogenimonas alkenigignens]|uniref:diguanylate cyclase n=1 Tax=Dehalogenimonas alkenigignens TaxID=1217799 RepID=UPI000D569082|nr:diguanylate cyclase [Dehalogenimonas alkenigignens]PVV84324.1 diguanylate cyclase [Dehalogenimonas alkenigignens]